MPNQSPSVLRLPASSTVSHAASDVVVCGLVTADCLFYLETLPRQAVKYRAHEADMVCGGGAANAAIAIARLGGQVAVLGYVGDDLYGEFIRQSLRDNGVDDAQLITVKNGRSAYSSIYIDHQGERQIVNYRGAGLHPDDVSLQLPDTAHAVLADTRWLAGSRQLFSQAHARGIPTVIDAEAPFPPGVFDHVSHIAFSRDGLSAAQGSDDIESTLIQASADYPAWVCVTDGAKGVHLLEHGRALTLPGFAVETVDTLAAGDVWHGAFTLKLAGGWTEIHAACYANAAAALKCAAAGGGDVAPNADAVTQLLQRHGMTG